MVALTNSPSNHSNNVPIIGNLTWQRTSAVTESSKISKDFLPIIKFAAYPVQASLPNSPPAHMKLDVSRVKFAPSRVARSWVWHVAWSTIGTSTSFWVAWYGATLENSFRPQPVTQHLIPVTTELGIQAVVIVGNWEWFWISNLFTIDVRLLSLPVPMLPA